MESRYDSIQDWLVEYLANLLKMDPDDIVTTTPFGRYGLDSMATVVMVGDLMEWLGRNIDMDTVYRNPTIEALARFLAEDEPGERVEA